MRIISKFRDYYDGLQHNGGDKSQIWVRQSAPIDDELVLHYYEILPEVGEHW